LSHDHLNDLTMDQFQEADLAAYALAAAIDDWREVAEQHGVGILMDCLAARGWHLVPVPGAYFTVWSWQAATGTWAAACEGNAHKAHLDVRDLYALAERQRRHGAAFLASPGRDAPIAGPLALNVRVVK
jgi:hypothetical protein